MACSFSVFRALHRDATRWREYRAQLDMVRQPLLGLQLLPYTADECWLAAAATSIPLHLTGELAMLLWNRSGRGQMTLDEAIARLPVLLVGRTPRRPQEPPP